MRWRRKRQPARVDLAYIHRLEYELGFRDDPPRGRYSDLFDVLKEAYTAAPGEVIACKGDPPQWPLK